MIRNFEILNGNYCFLYLLVLFELHQTKTLLDSMLRKTYLNAKFFSTKTPTIKLSTHLKNLLPIACNTII